VWSLWGADLSPFALKVEALLRFAGVPFRWLPASGSALEAHRFNLRRARLIAGRLPLTWPEKSPLDEFPLVPFLFGPGGENLYDSTAIGVWLDRTGPHPAGEWAPLLPDEEPALRFAARLVDEALDEVGLYLVHHNRWVVSARDNDAGPRLARQMRPLLGPAARVLARRFPARQVRRLPYLFSVAPADSHAFADLPARLRPPTREGFPATHALLEQAFRRLLGAVEPVLSARPFLFGERFTLADASVYGQLAMNRTDPSAWAWIGREAPATGAWIERLADGDFSGHRAEGPLVLDEMLAPLMGWLSDTFVPLMRQNADAWQRHRAAGETIFNEKAFDAGRSLYDGTLLGQPFRSVAKTFQVRVWRDLARDWQALAEDARARSEDARARLEALVPTARQLETPLEAAP
jgi:glutathione S-transferase